jgi:hypothetical protein
MNFFIESCKRNPDVRWRFYTDCAQPENRADNVDFVPISFEDYKAVARARIGTTFDPVQPYKVCDLRPALGLIHEPDIAGYPFFGYGDIDVIYGDISRFYGERQFADVDVVSTHTNRLSGHFAVLRNKADIRHAFERIPDYRMRLEAPDYSHVDEIPFAEVFWKSIAERSLFRERNSTILSKRGWHDGTMNYPQRWFWRNGRLTNDRDGDREFLYLHFMRWQSARWSNDPPQPGEAAWVGRDIIHVDWRQGAADGFCISPRGFTPI